MAAASSPAIETGKPPSLRMVLTVVELEIEAGVTFGQVIEIDADLIQAGFEFDFEDFLVSRFRP